ncbi:MAG: permease [Nanoarchaeota archaeon]|nr:permease [Nanoarchaeota archaeon]
MIEVLKFFVIQLITILSLMFILSSGIGFLRTYISQQRIKEMLVMKSGFKAYLVASGLGAITPFSPKDSIRLFSSFLKSGVPLGISLSFLISSPIINEYIIILLIIFFGLKVTIIYLFLGILISSIAGIILGKCNLEKYIQNKFAGEVDLNFRCSIRHKINKGLKEGLAIIKKMGILIFFGLILNSIIENYVSPLAITNIVEFFGFLGVPVAILIGIPIPGTGAALIPVAVALFEKGIPLGTALGFLIAVVGLSVPKAFKLRKVIEKKLIFYFFLVLGLATIILCYILNLIVSI